MKTPKIKQMTLPEFEAKFPDDEACREYLMARRWPKGPVCPRCGNEKVYALPHRKWHWQCAKCSKSGYRFSLLVGTIFENTNKPLNLWFKVIYLMLMSKKGMSALQIHRMLGFGSYRTAWSMCHRIRAGLKKAEFCHLLGFVEVDETFIGGKNHNRHWDKKKPGGGGMGSGKLPVVGAVSRKGNVVARAIDNVDTQTLTRFVHEAVSHSVSLLSTDASPAYRLLDACYPRGVVDHNKGQYVVGAIHTNTIEGFWSILKRGVVGTYHKVSRKYLPLYVAEFEFRYNNRKNPTMFETAIRAC